MKNKQKTPSSLHKKLLIFGVIAALIALFVGTAIFINSIITYPLGSQLNYIGKKDHGCIIGFCDTKPGSRFFYETDVSLEQLEKYFTQAELKDARRLHGWDYEGTYDLDFNHKNSKKFTITFYEKGPLHAEDYGFKISKEHLVVIESEDYEIAKTSL